MNETNAQQVITFRDIWELFLQRLVLILLVAAIAVAVFFVYTQAFYVPMYQSTATLYIAGDDSDEDSTSADDYNNYSLTLKVVNDCDYLLSSRSVVDQLIQDEQIKNMSYSVLQSRISTNNPANTRVLEVTVEAESPELAKNLVDRLCEIGESKINDVMGKNYVRLYEYGTLSTSPSNATAKLTYVLVGVIAAVITFGLCLLVFLLDDRIHSADHIEQILGLSVLGDIPNSNAQGQKGRYGYYRGRAYGPYGRPYGPYGKPYGSYGHNQNSNKKGRG